MSKQELHKTSLTRPSFASTTVATSTAPEQKHYKHGTNIMKQKYHIKNGHDKDGIIDQRSYIKKWPWRSCYHQTRVPRPTMDAIEVTSSRKCPTSKWTAQKTKHHQQEMWYGHRRCGHLQALCLWHRQWHAHRQLIFRRFGNRQVAEPHLYIFYIKDYNFYIIIFLNIDNFFTDTHHILSSNTYSIASSNINISIRDSTPPTFPSWTSSPASS